MAKTKKSNEEKPKLNAKEVEELIVKFAKEGMSAAKIGQILKDTYGILSAEKIVKKKITGILEENKIKPEIPEDLQNLIKNAETLKKHLEKHKMDKNAKRGLLITESNLRGLAKYYKRKGMLPKTWQY